MNLFKLKGAIIMKKFIKGISAGILSITILFGTTVTALAAYEGASGMAGSTSVYCQVGYDDDKAYAFVSASDYVDATMDGDAHYYDGVTKALSGGFDQRTYGEVTTVRSGSKVAVVSCYFTVCGEDGDYTHYSYAN